MSTSLERAQVLLQQNRLDLAQIELMQALPGDPENPRLHMLLALCFADGNNLAEAMKHARRTVELAPEWSASFRTLARVHMLRGDAGEALKSARIAVNIDPEDADNHVMLAQVQITTQSWNEALNEADTALSLEPDNQGALNMRGMALVKLGRQVDSEDTIKTSLAHDPENDVTHANMGWSLLHAGKAREAMGHFREALRINPQQEWARAGLVEAMKARNPLYSLLLRYFLWMSRFSSQTRFGLMIGAVVLINVLHSVTAGKPSLRLVGGAALLVYMSFVFTSWFSGHFFNLLLSTDRDGRYALSRRQLTGARIFGAGLALSFGVMFYFFYLLGRIEPEVCILALMWLFPLVVTLNARYGWPLYLMSGYTALVLIILGLATFTPAGGLFSAYIVMSVLSTWFVSFVPVGAD
ncbi:MAG: tetratricopeptide repeat protein [bacterium]